MYDDTINKSTIRTIAASPILYSASAAWFFSNQQIFKNIVNPIGNGFIFANSDHNPSDFFT